MSEPYRLEGVETVKERMLDLVSKGYLGIYRESGIALANVEYGNPNTPRKCSRYLSGHTKDAFIVLDMPPQTRLGLRKFGRTLISHTFDPVNDSRLFNVRDLEDDFEVTTLVFDEMSDGILKSVHRAKIPQSGQTWRDYDFLNYAARLGFLDEGKFGLSDLVWERGSETDIREIDLSIAEMMSTMSSSLN